MVSAIGAPDRNSSDEIAFAGVQSLPHEPPSLGAPDELQRPMKVVGDEARDLVLETLPGGVGKGKIVRISADP